MPGAHGLLRTTEGMVTNRPDGCGAVASLARVSELAGAELCTRSIPQRVAAARRVRAACIDSRKLRAGEVFVALEGHREDGHRFASEALSQGASAALVRRAWYKTLRLSAADDQVFLVADDPLTALQRWARGHRAQFGLPLAGVAGSNGKTTTRALLEHVLGSRGETLATIGNLNNHIGVPLTLLRLAESHRSAVVEMGIDHAGELAFLCGLAQPTAGVITNVGKEHLAGLGGVEAAAKAEFELAEYLLARGAVPVVNGDDRLLMSLVAGRRVLTFGIESAAEVRAVDVEATALDGVSFRLAGGPRVQLPLAGRHNVLNALAAVAVARTMGIPPAVAARSLERLAGTEPGRLQLREIGGVQVLDDTYNANPGSLRVALDLVRDTTVRGRRLVVLADMLELGSSSAAEHREAGTWLAGVDALWATGAFASDLAAGARASGVADIRIVDDGDALAARFSSVPRAGDLVLVKGSRAMRMERVVEALARRAAVEQDRGT